MALKNDYGSNARETNAVGVVYYFVLCLNQFQDQMDEGVTSRTTPPHKKNNRESGSNSMTMEFTVSFSIHQEKPNFVQTEIVCETNLLTFKPLEALSTTPLNFAIFISFLHLQFHDVEHKFLNRNNVKKHKPNLIQGRNRTATVGGVNKLALTEFIR